MPSPRSVATQKNHRDLVVAREEGFREGLDKGRKEIINFLETMYLAPDAPDRNTPEALAILHVAREASKHFRDLTSVKGRPTPKGRK